MAFSQKIIGSYNRLKTALKDLLEGQSSAISEPQGEGYPLLVLESSSDSVGFAVVNGAPEPAFASAYDSFKILYRQKHTAWKEQNLSFVVCRLEPESTHDAFFSSIETDVYFCRKYVVCLHRNHDELVRELLRLPFLPLSEGSAGVILRPPSAQTLLQGMNVSAQLARKIIVPLEYSAKRIVDQLLKEKELLPAIGSGAAPDMQQQDQPTERTRIKKMEIEAFRAYRKRQDFDLDADVVVFYGPNGLGKTSFFDALDYVCTGRIGRLCNRRISQDDFKNLARHLGTSISEGEVSMVVSHGGKVSSMRRSVADWGAAFIDTNKYDRASALQFLTSSHWEQKKARIENLERLFRATHLFGQSDPELLVEFLQDSTLSSELVHRMLALDDYASGLAKVSAILSQIDKQISENKHRTDILDTRANELQSQIKPLLTTQDAVEEGKQIRDMTVEIVKDLQAHISITITDIKPDQTSAREWRAMAESALKDAHDRLRQIQITESGFDQFAKDRSALKRHKDELSKLEEELEKQTVEYGLQQEARKKLTDSLEQERIVIVQTDSQFRALSELGDLQAVFQKTNSALRQWRQELNRAAGEANSIASEFQPLLATADNLRTRATEQREALQIGSQRLHTLATINDGLPARAKNHELIKNLKQASAKAQLAIHNASTIIDELKTVIGANEKELVGCKREYDELTTNQLKLTRLLDEIETHVQNGICPTCGIDHKSKAALIEKIHSQKQVRPAYVEALAKRCSELENALKRYNLSLETKASEQALKRAELAEITGKLTEVSGAVALFELTVTEAGFTLDQQLSASVARKLAEEEANIGESQEKLKKLELELISTSKRIKELEQKSALQTAAQKRASASIMPLEQQCANLRAKAESSGFSLEMSPDEFAVESAAVTARKADAEERIRKLTPQIETKTQIVNKLEKRIDELTDRIRSNRRDTKRLEESLRRYEEKAVSAIGREAISIDAISEQKRIASELVDHLDALRKRSLTLERIIDSEQRSVHLAELDAQYQSIAREKQAVVEETERMSAARKWFATVKDALDGQSSIAVANHVDAFGPLASLIQKRLRAVYGFGDISLFPKGNEIRVVVGWETKQVKPADYFSDSQKQILMLSLFLASRLTQTWSGFAPILMDDPVTHFDDLNAFGFVELIRGLASNSPGKRQFFISTCEDRLFELMLRKFNKLEGSAKFYRFEGIGSDGPIVRKQIIE